MTSAASVEDVAARCREIMPELSDAGIQEVAGQVFQVAPGTVDIALQDRLWEGFDLEAALGRITCPTLLLYGDWDHGAAMRETDAEFVRAHLPGAVVVKIPDAGHGFPQEQMETTLGHVLPFIQSL